MIYLKPMSELEFEKFKSISQKEYANNFSAVEGVELEAALKSAAEQFSRLAPEGLQTLGQLFFEAIDEKVGISIGYLWLGIQERMGRKVTSIIAGTR